MIILLIGPSDVGKSTVAKTLEEKLGLKRVSFDSLLVYHGLYDLTNNDIIEFLEQTIYDGYNLIDIGGNTLTDFTVTEQKRLIETLDKHGDYSIYYLKPYKDDKKSLKFLYKMTLQTFNDPKEKARFKKIMAEDIANSCIYENLKTESTIFTAEIENDTFKKLKIKDYKTYLREIVATSLIADIKRKYPEISNEDLQLGNR